MVADAPFTDVVRARRSARRFLPTPVPAADIRAVLEDAQQAPSNSNTQPWVVHLVSGPARDTLAQALLDAFEQERTSPDFTGDYGDGVHQERSQQQAAVTYAAHGVERSDHEGRRDVVRANLDFYGAPHVALLFLPPLGDRVRAAGDVGMYAQNFLLSLTARGYRGIPQAVLSVYADTVRDVLQVPAELKLLFGISFGTADEEAEVNHLKMPRVPLQRSVVVHDTPGVLHERSGPDRASRVAAAPSDTPTTSTEESPT